MANFMPVLAGRPDFGSKDRNSWLEVLMMFLGDPFRPINGRYQYTIPADAIVGEISGSSIWRNNAHGIRELNEFSESFQLTDTEVKTVSDRPCIMFAYNATDNVGCIYACYGTTYASSGAFIVHTNDATKFTVNAPLAGYIACYHNGTSAFVFDNQMGHEVQVFGCVISIGDQMTS